MAYLCRVAPTPCRGASNPFKTVTKMKKLLSAALLAALMPATLVAQPKHAEFFPLQDVRVTGGEFERACRLDIAYLLSLDADRLLAPYRKAAGLQPKAPNYPNWESTGLDGHIGGHYLSALSLMYASTGNDSIGARLHYVIDQLAECQAASGNGYLGGVSGGEALWKAVADGSFTVGAFDLHHYWVPLYNIHKMYAGLRDACTVARIDKARPMLIAFADWMIDLTRNLSDEQVQRMLISEHGGLNEVFADVYALTGDDRYLRLAQRFSHRTLLDPLLEGRDALTGMHANTQIPKVIGFKRIADLTGNAEWDRAALLFWENVTGRRTIAIGGNSVREHFHPTDNFAPMIDDIQGPESCNTYNMLRLSRMFYGTTASTRFVDYYECALYNHILSTQNPTDGGMVYFTPMRPGHYRVYSQPHTSFWCCVGSGLENHAKYGEMIYAHTADTLFVNLFIPSQLRWAEADFELEQITAFPDEAASRLVVRRAPRRPMSISVRVPQWCADAAVSCNGKAFATADGYATLTRRWRPGDTIDISLPMQLQARQMPDGSAYYAFAYGPLVLAAATDTAMQDGLRADDSRGGHIAHGRVLPLTDMPTLISEPATVADKVHRRAGTLTFDIDSLAGGRYSDLTLVPFHRLHDTRYIIYWPQATAAQFRQQAEALAKAEAAKAALAAATVDVVICGEQQPESDHAIAYEQSDALTIADRHCRRTRAWFSYRMDATGASAIVVRSTQGAFALSVDGRTLEPATVEREADDVVSRFELGTACGQCTVRIASPDGQPTAAVFEVRTLR